jgi:hypothetical protein
MGSLLSFLFVAQSSHSISGVGNCRRSSTSNQGNHMKKEEKKRKEVR